MAPARPGCSHARSLRRLTGRLARRFAATARHVEKHLFQVLPAILAQQMLRRIVVHDAASLHDDDALAQALHLGHVVRGQQDGCATLLAVSFQSAAHPVGGIGIERGGRLVEQQHFRAIDQRLGDRHAGLLPGRELSARAIEQVGEIEFLGEARDAAGKILDRVEPAEHRQVLPHRQARRHVDIGALEIHPVQHLIALPRHLGAEHLGGARRRHHETQDHGDGGGLARAIAAEKADDRAALDRKRDTVDGARGLIGLHELIDFDGVGGWHRSPDVTLRAGRRKPCQALVPLV